MRLKPKKCCPHPGCPTLTDGGPCEVHKKAQQKQQDQARGSAASRLYDHRWRAAREQFLREPEHMFCVECLKEGKRVLAMVVDHRIPHRGDLRLFWDRTNWDPLCISHHSSKTSRLDGGFGNPSKW